MATLTQIILYTTASGVLSLVGGIILLGKADAVKKFAIHFVSFAAGALLSIAFLDLWPEAAELAAEQTSINPNAIPLATFIGFLSFFLIERSILHFHTHHYGDDENHSHATPVLLMIGDAFHNFIDGVAIAATFLVDPSLGLVTAIGVAAHELPQEIGDFTVLLYHGWSKSKTLFINVLISLTSIAGAIVAYGLRDAIEPYLPHLLAFTAGSFIYIAASDLIPEVNANTRKDTAVHIMLLLFAGSLSVWLLAHWFGV